MQYCEAIILQLKRKKKKNIYLYCVSIYIHTHTHTQTNIIYLFLIEGWLLYSIVLVSTKHQHKSAIGLPMSPPTTASLPPLSPSHPSRLLLSPSLSSLSHTNSRWLSLIYGNVCFHVTCSIIPPFPSSPASHVHKSVLYVCVGKDVLLRTSISIYF